MEIIVGKTAGFCFGVKRAVEGSEEVLKNTQEDVYCLGEIVHNRDVVEDLKQKGLKFIDNIQESKGKTIIRAHGVTEEVYEYAKQNDIHLIDYTCPNVLKIHDIAYEYSQKGYYVCLCGSKTHPENIGTLSYCGENVSVIENEDDTLEAIENLKRTGIKKLLLISQTTFSLEKFYIIREILENELPSDVEFVQNNTICKATELRQLETKKIAQEVDYMIIIGGKNSSNTRKLYDIAKKECEHSVCVENKGELDIEEINKYGKIGIMAGASTPGKSIDEVVEGIQTMTI